MHIKKNIQDILPESHIILTSEKRKNWNSQPCDVKLWEMPIFRLKMFQYLNCKDNFIEKDPKITSEMPGPVTGELAFVRIASKLFF